MSSWWCDFMAGWIGGCGGILIGHPFDTLKVRQQAFKGASLLKITNDCMKNEGIKGMFKGMSYPLLSAGALNSLFFGVYGVTLEALSLHQVRDRTLPNNYRDIFLAGCAGGSAQLLVSCPVDLVKIKLQTQTNSCKFRGPLDVVLDIYRRYGIAGLYKGLVPMMFRDLKASGIYMVLYAFLMEKTNKTGLNICLAGGFAGVISWMSIIYLDVVKSRIQADNPENPRYKGMLDCFHQCYREGGPKIFSRGLIMMSIRAFPLNGATFLGYEYFLSGCKTFGNQESTL